MSTEPEYTPDVLQKIETAKEKKAAGDAAFQQKDLQKALLEYHSALLYLNGIHKNAMAAAMPGEPPSDEKKPRTEVEELIVKVYSNMSQCQVQKGNWKKVIEYADKALEKDSSNVKALYRKARALGEQGFLEKAEKIYNDLLPKADPKDKAKIQEDLARFRAEDKKREKQYQQKFKGFLNKDKTTD
ncbi:hypothetical protein K474DRAFT_1659915 [Panus rudis PR-1116 ss-1]|nr:hypothetical protein K474DRAFT_1659915 [Panus rudis PR-1116 ss-1]